MMEEDLCRSPIRGLSDLERLEGGRDVCGGGAGSDSDEDEEEDDEALDNSAGERPGLGAWGSALDVIIELGSG